MAGNLNQPLTRIDRRVAGVCGRALCGCQVADDSDYCEKHRDEKRARDREAKKRRRARRGRCRDCPARTRRRRCDTCRAKHADEQRRRRGVVATDEGACESPKRRGVASAQQVKTFETLGDLEIALREVEQAVDEVRKLDAAKMPEHRLESAMVEPMARLELVRRLIVDAHKRHRWEPFTASAGAIGPSRPLDGSRKRRSVPSPHRGRPRGRGARKSQDPGST